MEMPLTDNEYVRARINDLRLRFPILVIKYA